MSHSLWPHGLHYTRFPCLSPTPGAYSNSCPLSCWCHPTISSSVIPFSYHLQSFPPSGCFQMSQLFASGGQIIGVSASASVLPMNIQGWFPLEWLDRLAVQETLKISYFYLKMKYHTHMYIYIHIYTHIYIHTHIYMLLEICELVVISWKWNVQPLPQISFQYQD